MDSKPVYLTTNVPRTPVEDMNIPHRCYDVTVGVSEIRPYTSPLFRRANEGATATIHLPVSATAHPIAAAVAQGHQQPPHLTSYFCPFSESAALDNWPPKMYSNTYIFGGLLWML
jgi:hypothetical protein